MNTRIIAHTADLHFSKDNLEQTIPAFQHVVTESIKAGAHALVIAGDLWDRALAVDEKSPLVPVVRAIREAAAFFPVIIIRGNHDPAGSLDVFGEIRAHYPVIVANEPRQELLNGVLFSMLPYPTKAFLMSRSDASQDDGDRMMNDALRSIVAGFGAMAADVPGNHPHVLVYHGNIAGCSVETGQTLLGGDVMVGATDLLSLSGADYVALGHIHMRQHWHDGRVSFPGSHVRLNFGELEERSFNLATLGEEFSVQRIPIPGRARVVVNATWSEDGGVVFPGNEGTDFSAPDYADADVSLRLLLPPDVSLNPACFEQMFQHAHSLKIETERIRVTRVRSEAVTTARTLADKVAAWGEATGQEIPPGVLEKAAVVEGGVR